MSTPPFVFSLASVLRIRRHEVEQAKQVLSRVLRRRHEAQTAVDEAQQRLGELLSNGPSGPSGPNAFRQYAAYCQAAQAALAEARTALASSAELEVKARRQLVECHRAEEALQTIREQEKAEHQETIDQHESAFLDEQAVTGYFRQRNAPRA